MVDAGLFLRRWRLPAMRTARAALLAAIASSVVACSLLLDEDATQCSRDQDCAALGFTGWVCDEHQNVCIADPEPGHGGRDTAGSAGASSGSGGDLNGGGKSGSAGASSGGGGGLATAGMGGAAMGGSTGGAGAPGMAGAAGVSGSGGSLNPPTCDASACQSASGKCVGAVCVISCTTADCKPVCPAGMPCRVECSSNTCNQGVDCTAADSCQINCPDNSCTKGVSCSGSSCTVSCSGQTACSITPVVCSAKSCNITCSGGQSCHQVQCSAQVDTCSIDCGGVQACGTLLSSGADHTEVSCAGTDTCAGAKALCCQDGVTCSGNNAPSCN
jgi:hypothetical protein